MRFIASVLLIFGGLIQAQVTNIEASRVKTDTTGWYGEVNTGFKFVKEVGSVFSLNADVRVQYKTAKDLYLVLGEYNWSGASSKTNTHNAYLHLRYNRKLKPSFLRWEVFSQYQFNKITRINLRILNGTGPRFKLLGKEKALIYLGVLYMFEYTKELNQENTILYLKEHRNSSYLSFSIFPNNMISILSTSYYQPRLDQWKDYRISNITEFRAKISKKLYIGMAYKFNFDTYPSEGISRVTHSFENKIGVAF